MALKLSVGLSKKVGQPDYGSLGASCGVEVELDPSLLRDDLDGFHKRVRDAFVACRQAVNDELARPRIAEESPRPAAIAIGRDAPEIRPERNGAASLGHPSRRPQRKATESQARALRAIAHRRGLDLDSLLADRFGVGALEDLGIGQASRLIDELGEPAAAR